jgi:hypothetical protein
VVLQSWLSGLLLPTFCGTTQLHIPESKIASKLQLFCSAFAVYFNWAGVFFCSLKFVDATIIIPRSFLDIEFKKGLGGVPIWGLKMCWYNNDQSGLRIVTAELNLEQLMGKPELQLKDMISFCSLCINKSDLGIKPVSPECEESIQQLSYGTA